MSCNPALRCTSSDSQYRVIKGVAEAAPYCANSFIDARCARQAGLARGAKGRWVGDPRMRATNDINVPSTLARSLSGMGADGSSTARVQRGPSEAARCASTEDHQPPSHPFYRARSASKKGTWSLPPLRNSLKE